MLGFVKTVDELAMVADWVIFTFCEFFLRDKSSLEDIICKDAKKGTCYIAYLKTGGHPVLCAGMVSDRAPTQ